MRAPPLSRGRALRRAFEVHGDRRFERVPGLSRSHLYHLRASRTYRMKRTRREKTRASPVAIAVRKASEPNGRPGFVRVDTVHLGDRDGRKGVYVVNMQVDAKGKMRRTCRHQDVLTPLAKLKSLPGAARFLRQGVRFDDLDRARDETFRKVHGAVPVAA